MTEHIATDELVNEIEKSGEIYIEHVASLIARIRSDATRIAELEKYSGVRISGGNFTQYELDVANALLLVNRAEAAEAERDALRAALEFYANENYWMGITENSDRSNLTAHGPHFDGTSNGWVEARAALSVAVETKGGEG